MIVPILQFIESRTPNKPVINYFCKASSKTERNLKDISYWSFYLCYLKYLSLKWVSWLSLLGGPLCRVKNFACLVGRTSSGLQVLYISSEIPFLPEAIILWVIFLAAQVVPEAFLTASCFHPSTNSLCWCSCYWGHCMNWITDLLGFKTVIFAEGRTRAGGRN